MKEKDEMPSGENKRPESLEVDTQDNSNDEKFHKLTARKDTEDVKAIKVEKVEKKSFDFFVIVKWLVGLYIAGAVAVLIESILILLTGYVYNFISFSQFANAELSAFGNAIRTPLVILSITMPFILTALLSIGMMRYVLRKLSVFTEKHEKIYLLIFSSIVVLMTISVYFSGV